MHIVHRRSGVPLDSASARAASMSRDLDDEAHDAAAAVGLRVLKSRRRSMHGMSGGYMVVEPTLHVPVFGTDYDKTAQEVIDFCISVE